jgi:hypothetical protein
LFFGKESRHPLCRRVYNHAPCGFDAVNKLLIPNEAEQRTLAEIKEMRAAATSYSRIANELNACKVPAKRGVQWHSQSVKTILQTAA